MPTARWRGSTAATLAVLSLTLVAVPTPATAGLGPADVGAPTPVVTDDGGLWAGDPAGPGTEEFSTFGTRWTRQALTYGFVNHTLDLSVAAQEAAVRSALGTWSSVTPLTFSLVPDCGLASDAPACLTPDIRISFGAGDHGAGPNDPDFDGPGGTAAHAFYPPPNGASIAGDLHIDDSETWTTSGLGGVDLESMALHEIGHALGLTHATGAQCPLVPGPNRPIMCGTIIGVDRTLAPDDIAGIQSLYGAPGVICGGRAVTVNLLTGALPTAAADVILGTPGTDIIAAGAGADLVCGQGGDDRIDLGPGTDRGIGGNGNDLIYGRLGVDRLEGGTGGDRLYGGDSGDTLLGSTGGDGLDGGSGADTLYAGTQVDACHGRAGRDRSRGCEHTLSIESRRR